MKRWSTALRCPGCKTVITYHDEVPPWRDSDLRKRRMVEADLYLTEQGGEVYFATIRAASADTTSPQALTHAAEDAAWARHSPFWLIRGAWGSATAYAMRQDIDLRCVECPVCRTEVFLEDAIDPINVAQDALADAVQT